MVMCPDGSRNEERLCWLGPVAITGLKGIDKGQAYL
jgi:hypothetical protein